jgi:hypothetical protein
MSTRWRKVENRWMEGWEKAITECSTLN